MKRAENCIFLLSVIVEVLGDGHVDIVDGGQLRGIAATVGKRALSGLDVASVRVVGQVSHGLAGAVLAAPSRRSPRSPVPPGLTNRAVAGGIAVQIGVNAALDVRPGAGLVGVDGSKFPVAHNVLQEPVRVLEERQIVKRFEA